MNELLDCYVDIKSDPESSSKTINISIDFPNFQSYFKFSESYIYLAIVESYELRSLLKKDQSLIVNGCVQGDETSSTFPIDESNADLLLKTIIPFFEEREEYEICERIMKIRAELNQLESASSVA